MKTLLETESLEELKRRMGHLQPDSPRQWGKMTPAQALAHCSAQMEMVLGERFPRRGLVGRIVGRFVKPSFLGAEPLRRNMPTDRDYIITDERDLDVERERLRVLLDRFASGGAAACTRHPHSFLGPMSPNEWARLMYKHLDHHLQQFNV